MFRHRARKIETQTLFCVSVSMNDLPVISAVVAITLEQSGANMQKVSAGKCEGERERKMGGGGAVRIPLDSLIFSDGM